MKILFLIRTLGRGGAERQLTTLAKALHTRGHEISVVVLYGGGDFEADLRAHGIRVVSLDKRGRWDVIGFVIRFLRTLVELHPDVVHGYMPAQNVIALLSKVTDRRTRVVWGLRDSVAGYGSMSSVTRLVFWLSCRLSKRADLVICNSQAGKRFYIDSGYSPKVACVPNGIDTDAFSPQKERGLALRKYWQVADKERLVGLVARFDPVKDHETFLRSCAHVRRRLANVRFVCIGGGDDGYRKEVERLASNLGLDGSMIWAGELSDMASAYSALDVAVCSSAYEGFPNSVAEAMSCGVPVVSTDVGDAKLMTDGIGLCVSPHDAEALAASIEKMLSGNLREAGRLGRNRILERYSVKRLADCMEKHFGMLSCGRSDDYMGYETGK